MTEAPRTSINPSRLNAVDLYVNMSSPATIRITTPTTARRWRGQRSVVIAVSVGVVYLQTSPTETEVQRTE